MLQIFLSESESDYGDEEEEREYGPVDDIGDMFIEAKKGEGAHVGFKFNDTRISVSVFPSSSEKDGPQPKRLKQSRTEDELIDHLCWVMDEADEYDDFEEILVETKNRVVNGDWGMLREVTAVREPIAQGTLPDLHCVLYPTTHTFRLREADDGNAVLVPIKPNEAYKESYYLQGLCPATELDRNLDPGVPQFSSKEIHIIKQYSPGPYSTVSKARVNGQVMLCKAFGAGSETLAREIGCLESIHKTFTPDTTEWLRLPKFLGYAVHADTGRVIGFLREFVSGYPLNKIRHAKIKTRKKWFSQISETIERLHRVGMVWGDVKPHNIVIDDDKRDAWFIDFGGDFTQGWVDKKLANTLEGDLQGLGKIRKFLKVDADE